MAEVLASCYVHGATPDFNAWDRPWLRRKLSLPTYPFQRKRYYVDCEQLQRGAASRALSNGGRTMVPVSPHRALFPLTGVRLDIAGTVEVWEFRLNQQVFPEVGDNQGILHVGHYKLMIANSTVYRQESGDAIYFENMEFLVPLMVPQHSEKLIHLHLLKRDEGGERFEIYGKNDATEQWHLHVRGIVKRSLETALSAIDLRALEEGFADEEEGGTFYARAAERGLHFGASVRCISQLKVRDNRALTRLEIPSNGWTENNNALGVAPGVFDSCAQLFLATGSQFLKADSVAMVVGWERMIVFRHEETRLFRGPLWCYFEVSGCDLDSGEICADYALCEATGRVLARAHNLRGRILRTSVLEGFRPSERSNAGEGGTDNELVRKIRTLPSQEQKTFVMAYLSAVIAESLKIPVDELDLQQPLRMLGIDSLVGVEMKLRIDRELCTSVPMEILVTGPVLEALADQLLPLIPIQKKHEPQRAGDGGYLLDRDLWLPCRTTDISGAQSTSGERRGKPKVRLFCLPYGGGNAAIYCEWQQLLTEDVQVCPVNLPGRGDRLRETAIDSWTELVDVLEAMVAEEADIPYAFYGHSMGGLVAYCLAHRMEKHSVSKPVHLFVGGYSSPTIAPNPFLETLKKKFHTEGLAGIPSPCDVRAREAAKRVLGGLADIYRSRATGSDVPGKFGESGLGASGEERVERAYPSLADIPDVLLRTMLADLKIVESYTHEFKDPLHIPITVFHGNQDDRVTLEEMQAWRQLTISEFQCHVLSGDHFFLEKHQARDSLLKLVVGALSENVRGSSLEDRR